MFMQFIKTIDDGLRTDVLMFIQASDVCTQLGHIVRIVLIVVLILVEPIEFRVSATLELMTEDVVFTLFWHATNSHLFLSLMGTIRNSCTLIVVHNTTYGAILIVCHSCLILSFMSFSNWSMSLTSSKSQVP